VAAAVVCLILAAVKQAEMAEQAMAVLRQMEYRMDLTQQLQQDLAVVVAVMDCHQAAPAMVVTALAVS
jgi:hypothetical protein